MKSKIKLVPFFLVLLLASTLAPLPAQDNVDLVVLLDSSQSMFKYYNEVTEFVITGIVNEYVRLNDTFHLISFSDSTQIEITQILKTQQDIKKALAGLYLLYPLGKNTDILTALRNTYQYVADLPSSTKKLIVLITDGIHAPGADSPFASLSAADVKAEIDKISGKIREEGWEIKIVRIPFDSTQAPGEVTDGVHGKDDFKAPGSGDYLSDLSSSLGADISEFATGDSGTTVGNTINLPAVVFPTDLGKRDYRFKFPLKITNGSATDVTLEIRALMADSNTDILAKKQFITLKPSGSTEINLDVEFPDSWPSGPSTVTFEPVFSDGVRVTPAVATIAIDLKHVPLSGFFRFLASRFYILVLIVLVLLVGFFVLRYIRSIHKRADTPIVEAVMNSAAVRGESAAQSRNAVRPSSTVQASVESLKRAEEQARAGRPDSSALLAASAHKDQASRTELLQSYSNKAKSANEPSIIGEFKAHQSESGRHVTLKGDESAAPTIHTEILNTYSPDSRDRASLLSSWAATVKGREIIPATATVKHKAILNIQPVAYQARIVRPATLRVEFKVDDQNPNIGMRNIKTLHAGGIKSLGSGSSDFFVFLLPVPKRLADVHFDGESITIVPRRPEFFPDHQGAIQVGLGDKVRIVNLAGRELFISFERYIPALEKVNKLLHCIEAPGVF